MNSPESVNLTKLAQPYHLTLTKNAKGAYQWEISVHAESENEVFKIVKRLDDALASKYGDVKAE